MMRKQLDPGFRALLDRLEIAWREEDEIKQRLFALAIVCGYLASIGVDRELLKPIEEMWHEHFDQIERREHGGAIRPISETIELARAAAIVTHFATGMD